MGRIYLPPSPQASSDSVRASMRGNRSSNTKPEIMLVELLKGANVIGFSVDNKGVPGSPDLAFSDIKLAVFINGCFWHRCPHCNPHFPETNKEYWSAKFARNKARDARTRAVLRANGWRNITIWECRLKRQPERVVYRIRRALEKASE